MFGVANGGALVAGAPLSSGEAMAKRARVTRGVYIRGVPYAEGAEGSVGTVKQPGDAFVLSAQEFAELKASYYVVEAPEKAPETAKEPEVKAEEPKKGK